MGNTTMSAFEDREKSFENKFAHDEEVGFKTRARRDRLFGAWAAEKLGKHGPEAETYAKEVVAANVNDSKGEAGFRKVRADFEAAGVSQSEHRIRRTLDEMMAKAIAET
jgi:hypothetical protein